MPACDIVDLVRDLVLAYEDMRTACGTNACEDIPDEDIPPEDLDSLCGDGDGLIQEIHDKGATYITRTGSTADPSYPDPGAPPATMCLDIETWIVAKTEYFENIVCPQCPQYQNLTRLNWTTFPWLFPLPSENFLTGGQYKYTDRIELWEWAPSPVYPYPYIWRIINTHNFTYSGTWQTTGKYDLAGYWANINNGAWTRWKWRLKNYDNHNPATGNLVCCIETPVMNQAMIRPETRKNYQLDYASASEYDADGLVESIVVPSDAWSNGGDQKYLYATFDGNTDYDKGILTVNGVVLLDTGFVIGENQFVVTMPDVSTVPVGATIDFSEFSQTGNWHSGWSFEFEVTDVAP